MSRLYLIRHATTALVGKAVAGRTPGISLSEEGRTQTERLAASLVGVPFAAVYSSPMERCRETAGPLAARSGLPVIPDDGLNELHYGDWTGRTLDEVRADDRWTAYNQFRSAGRIPGGEATLDTQARAVAALLRLADAHPDQTVAVVSHGDVIRLSLAYFLGVPTDLFLRLTVDPASVSVLDLHPWGPTVRCVNATY